MPNVDVYALSYRFPGCTQFKTICSSVTHSNTGRRTQISVTNDSILFGQHFRRNNGPNFHSLARATLSHRVAAAHSCLLHTLTHPLRKSSSSSSSSVSIEDIVAPFGGIISADAAAVVADDVSVASVLTQADEEVLASDSRMWLISGGIGLGINLLRPRPVSGVDREHEQTHGIYIHIGLCQLKLCA